MDNLPDRIALEGSVVGQDVDLTTVPPLERLRLLVRDGLLQPTRMGKHVTMIAMADALPVLAEMGINTAGEEPITRKVLGLEPDQRVVSLEDVGRNLGISTKTLNLLLQQNLPTHASGPRSDVVLQQNRLTDAPEPSRSNALLLQNSTSHTSGSSRGR